MDTVDNRGDMYRDDEKARTPERKTLESTGRNAALHFFRYASFLTGY